MTGGRRMDTIPNPVIGAWLISEQLRKKLIKAHQRGPIFSSHLHHPIVKAIYQALAQTKIRGIAPPPYFSDKRRA